MSPFVSMLNPVCLYVCDGIITHASHPIPTATDGNSVLIALFFSIKSDYLIIKSES